MAPWNMVHLLIQIWLFPPLILCMSLTTTREWHNLTCYSNNGSSPPIQSLCAHPSMPIFHGMEWTCSIKRNSSLVNMTTRLTIECDNNVKLMFRWCHCRCCPFCICCGWLQIICFVHKIQGLSFFIKKGWKDGLWSMFMMYLKIEKLRQ